MFKIHLVLSHCRKHIYIVVIMQNKIKFEVKARILVTLSTEEYDVICQILHERRAAAIPCVTIESAHNLTSIRSANRFILLGRNITSKNIFYVRCNLRKTK